MKTLIAAAPFLIYASISTFESSPTGHGFSDRVIAGVDNYKIDGTHSTLLYKVRHLGVSDFWGRFNKFGGTFAFDPEKPAKSRLEMTIDANSIDSAAAGRDRHLKSPQFFNVKQHPEIKFVSKKFASTGEKTFKVTGDMTLLGETKSITVECTYVGKKDTGSPRFGTRAGFSARFEFKRSDFGMNYMVKNGALGDDIEVLVNLECVLQK